MFGFFKEQDIDIQKCLKILGHIQNLALDFEGKPIEVVRLNYETFFENNFDISSDIFSFPYTNCEEAEFVCHIDVKNELCSKLSVSFVDRFNGIWIYVVSTSPNQWMVNLDNSPISKPGNSSQKFLHILTKDLPLIDMNDFNID